MRKILTSIKVINFDSRIKLKKADIEKCPSCGSKDVSVLFPEAYIVWSAFEGVKFINIKNEDFWELLCWCDDCLDEWVVSFETL